MRFITFGNMPLEQKSFKSKLTSALPQAKHLRVELHLPRALLPSTQFVIWMKLDELDDG
jgi:hypothetical protein